MWMKTRGPNPVFARETRTTTAVEGARGVEISVNPYSPADLANVEISASFARS
jgi:hypothetical protein